MTTDRQKSFIATLGTSSSPLHFLDVLHAKRVLVPYSLASGGFFTGRRQVRDDSHLLGTRPEVPIGIRALLKLYFRYIGPGYRLYIRTPGDYYGMCLSTNEDGLLGAFTPSGSETFKLVDSNGATLNLDHLKSDAGKLFLQVNGSGWVHAHKVHDSPYQYIAATGGLPMSFDLRIEQRNAPYLSNPAEA